MATSLDAPRRSRRARAAEVLDERLGLKALQYPVPEHANNLGWSLGGLTAAALFILIATGIFLTQFYNPTPEVANASVRHIDTGVWAGRFVRGSTTGLRKRCMCTGRLASAACVLHRVVQAAA